MHAAYCICVGGNHGVLGLAGKGLDPSIFSVYFLQTQLVLVAATGCLGKLSCLISVERLLYIVDFNDKVLFLRFSGSNLPGLGVVAGGGGLHGPYPPASGCTDKSA